MTFLLTRVKIFIKDVKLKFLLLKVFTFLFEYRLFFNSGQNTQKNIPET